MFNAHWSESGDARGVVTYSNADTKDVVVVKYNEWARVIDEDGDAFWWNVVTQESAWERPGWNQGSENGVKYYFNNITKWASLEMPYGYPPEYTVEELKALSLPAVSKVATPGPTHDPTSPVIDVKDGAASTPMLTPAPAVGIGGHVLSVPTPAPSTMSKEEKAAQDVMMRKYKKQFLSRACLSRIPLLANLAPHDEVLITSLFRLQVCPAGALLCEAGEAVKNMYVVCQGVVALSAVDPVSAQESCVAHVHVRPLSSSPHTFLYLVLSRPCASSSSWSVCLCVAQPGGAVNVEGLMHESFPSCFKSVGYGSVSCAPTITGSPSITSAAAAVVISAIPPVLDDTASAAGGSATSAGTDVCHLLVLPFSTLAEKIGQYWLLDRRRNLISSNPRFLSLFLESVPFFEGLTHDQMATLCESGDVIQRPGNFVLISEGLPGDAFFVLIHGQVEVSLKGVTTATRGPGQHFGETSLVKGIPCTATVRSLSHCLVLCYHKTAFLSIIRSFPGVRQGLEEFIEQCTVVNLKALKLSLFHRVPEDRMEQLARSAVFRVLLPGEMLYSKGEMSDTGFVVSQVWVKCLFVTTHLLAHLFLLTSAL